MLVTILAVLPATIAVILLSAAAGPRILSGFGDGRGPEGYPRADGPHRGVDVAGSFGSPVLAAADGNVLPAGDNRDACGLIVVIQHRHGYRTIHCHLSTIAVGFGDEVRRGQVIGAIGTTGLRAGPGYEHVHWELRREGVSEDPLPMTVGCFDGAKVYPVDRLVLTYPVKC